MANSKYEYVRNFEQPDILLPHTWIVIRIDGRKFHKFSTRYAFDKPNDIRALHLMNAAAEAVVRELPDVILAYGDSDEYSFILHQSCTLFERRSSKLVTTIVSTFTANYIHLWSNHFDSPLLSPLPTFDGRAVCYPNVKILRDYLCWRQVDCHINNLYNTTFWALVKGGMKAAEAEKALSGTESKDKNEILFSRFHVNYNNEPEIFKKGSVVFRHYDDYHSSAVMQLARSKATSNTINPCSTAATECVSVTLPSAPSKTAMEKQRKQKQKAKIVVEHIDIIKDQFWEERPWILEGK